MVVQVAICALAVLLFALGLTPFWRKMTSAQLAWLAFSALLFTLPWLPITELTFGATSIKVFQQKAIRSDRATLDELRAFEAKTTAQLAEQEAIARSAVARADDNSKAEAAALEEAKIARRDADRAEERYKNATQISDMTAHALSRVGICEPGLDCYSPAEAQDNLGDSITAGEPPAQHKVHR